MVVGAQDSVTPTTPTLTGRGICESGVPGATLTGNDSCLPPINVTVTTHCSAEAVGIAAMPSTASTIAAVSAPVATFRLLSTIGLTPPAVYRTMKAAPRRPAARERTLLGDTVVCNGELFLPDPACSHVHGVAQPRGFKAPSELNRPAGGQTVAGAAHETPRLRLNLRFRLRLLRTPTGRVAAMSEDKGLRDRVVKEGEEAIGKLAQELLDNPVVSGALSAAFETRERAMRAQELAMGALNLPSASDLERLTRRLRSVSQRLEGIEDGLDRLEQRIEGLGSSSAIDARLAAIEEKLDALSKQG